MAKGRCLWGIQHWRELLSQAELRSFLRLTTSNVPGSEASLFHRRNR
jgi:hypothetical protein